MAKEVQRPKLGWLEKLYLPTLWNGFKVTLRHFFSWKKSEVYAAKNEDIPRNETSGERTKKHGPDETIPASSGSGFVISKTGHIVTNHHVIDGCNQVEVHQKGKSYKATVIQIDIINDLAVLKANFSPTTVFWINL